MSLDKSLKSRDSLVRHRNVLTRSERLAQLEEDQRWSEGDSVLSLPKVTHRKAVISKKDKAKEGGEEGVEAAVEAGEAATGQAEAADQSAKS